MPERFSVMLLARHGKMGVDIVIANVLGSNILNSSLLLGLMIIAAAFTRSNATTIIPVEALFAFQVYWTAVITFLAMFLMLDKRLTRREGQMLLAIYVGSMALQFLFLDII